LCWQEEQLGAGAAGVVSLATHKETGERVAIKDIGTAQGLTLFSSSLIFITNYSARFFFHLSLQKPLSQAE
jgi:hypothetical protein